MTRFFSSGVEKEFFFLFLCMIILSFFKLSPLQTQVTNLLFLVPHSSVHAHLFLLFGIFLYVCPRPKPSMFVYVPACVVSDVYRSLCTSVH